MSFQIAIDGPVSAGKGTVSRLVADRLGLLYVDTGAMYRAVAYRALEKGISLGDESSLGKLINQIHIELKRPTPETADGRLVTVLLDGLDVSWQIRTEKIGRAASAIANFKLVRQVLVKIQQQIALNQNIIMEGRDITSVVLPNADLKIYMTANQVVRAKRRHLEQLIKGQDITFEEVLESLVSRDRENISRKESPLKIMPDAWVIDTSDLAIPQVVAIICSRAELLLDRH